MGGEIDLMKKHNLNASGKMEILNPNNIPNLLKKGEVGAVLEWEVTDSGGKVTGRGQQRAKSFVKHFMSILYAHMAGVLVGVEYDYRWYVNLWNTSWIQVTAWYGSFYMEAAASSYAGISVGSGSTSPTINDTQMAALITTGTERRTTGLLGVYRSCSSEYSNNQPVHSDEKLCKL